MKCLYITLIILSLNASQGSIYSSIRLGRRHHDVEESSREANHQIIIHNNKDKEDAKDAKAARLKAKVLKKVRTHEKDMNVGDDLPQNQLTEDLSQIGREHFHMDPVLNELRRSLRSKQIIPSRRKRLGNEEESSGKSSSLELANWMDQWDEEWMQKKFEALNSSQLRGDVVNMAAARPWGVPCGDPNQHDMPWGTCTLQAECDAEYRIYRGDYFCGKTQYICCGILFNNYDMYQALDVSFDDSEFASDSKEKAAKGPPGSEPKKNVKQQNRRRKDRAKRKRDMQKSIKQIIKEITKILNRAFRNGTAQRKKKTKELKKFVADLKKAFKKERNTIVNLHEYEMVKIDDNLAKRLDQVKEVNQAFMNNDTFRDIVINGTVNKARVLRLLKSHPDLAKLLANSVPGSKSRRWNDLEDGVELEEDDPNALEYDVEYGKLYF